MTEAAHPFIQPAGDIAAAEAVKLEDISLIYPSKTAQSEVLRRIDLTIEEGEFVCVLGPSGCGKTSLLKVIAGYEQPSAGTVSVFERPHGKPHPEVGVVFQHANLFPWLSVQRNTEFGLKMSGLPKAKRKQVANNVLEQVGLSNYASLLPYQLSGGMKQRVAIARALAPQPRILLLDEPFASLDALTREALQQLLRKLWLQTGKTILFITHDVDEALLLGTRIITMQGSPGRIHSDIANPLNSRIEPFASGRKHPRFAELRESLVRSLRTPQHDPASTQ
jgi:taurine transport system ATP-binding protein